jgi:hypothetical protein
MLFIDMRIRLKYLLENINGVRETLINILSKIPDKELYASGDCTEFAFVLHEWFGKHGIPSEIQICKRTYVELDEPDFPVWCYSHAVVEALNTEWDAFGPNAIERWESRWNNEETELQTSSEFEWYPVSPNRLNHVIGDWGGSRMSAETIVTVQKYFS